MENTLRIRENCRICESKDLEKVADIGPAPLANNYKENYNEGFTFYPLILYKCSKCSLFQLKHIISQKELFRDYDYLTGETSDSLPAHFQDYAESTIERLNLNKPFVLEVGSNDGTLLRAFKQKDAKVLGVDPAKNLAKKAENNGINTIPEFFNKDLAKEIKSKHGQPNLIVANNVLGHVDNLNSFVEGVSILLNEDSYFVFEVPYISDLLEKNELDTIYHEHRSYFGLKPLKRVFEKNNLHITNVERKEIHGGSIRVTVNPKETEDSQLDSLIQEEENNIVNISENFRTDIEEVRETLTSFLSNIDTESSSISGYGAPAKAAILLNFCNLGSSLDYAVDEIAGKQHKYIPGSTIEIKDPQHFRENYIDYCLLLAWNYEEEIINKELDFLKSGGKFIVPIPEPKVVSYKDGEIETQKL